MRFYFYIAKYMTFYIKLTYVLGSSSFWICQILNFEYLTCVVVSASRGSGKGRVKRSKKNMYSKFEIRNVVQIDELPRTLDNH